MDAVCGLDLYSGRSNPEWKININDEEKIKSLFEGLSEIRDSDLKSSPVLGYRGAFMKSGNEEIRVSQGIVRLYKEGDMLKTYIDRDKDLEKAIISTAPDNLDIPLDMINDALK